MEIGELANRGRHRLVPEQALSGRSAMHVQLNKFTQSARGVTVCEFCARPWFGLVTYCPYCGRKPSVTTINQEPDDLLQSDAALASGQETMEMPADEVHGEEAESPGAAPRGTPPRAVPISAEIPPVERIRPTASPLDKKASTLLFRTAVAGVSAMLVLWIGAKLLAPKTNEGASPRPPVSTSGIPSSSRGPSTRATQVPSTPPRTGTAVPPQSNAAPVPSTPPRTGTAVPPRSDRRSLCSAASETAGLCKSQE